jgi:mitogen-activated protein kinase 1/3
MGDDTTPIEELKFNEVYLVLRKCDMDLKKLIKSGKHLDETQVKSIVYDILCGLKYLHKAKIIHRDLKPGNILVNNDCTIQICDFGLARSMDGIYREEVSVEKALPAEVTEEEFILSSLALRAQNSFDSNSHMSS